MFGPILDVAIGLVFTFLLFSILLSTVNEAFVSILKLRAKALEDAFVRLIENPETPKNFLSWSHYFGLFGKAKKIRTSLPPGALSYDKVYEHPLVGGDQGRSLPSYVPADQFASALMAVVQDGASGHLAADVASGAAALPPGKLRDALVAITDEAGADLEKLKKGIEDWFNAAMDRLSGDYKRCAQLLTFLFALVLAVGFNVDATHAAYRLYNEPALREAMATAAGDYLKTNGAPGETPCTISADTKVDGVTNCQNAIKSASSMLQTTAPVGWKHSWLAEIEPTAAAPSIARAVFLSVTGWIITALAGMMGAAYWFQLLTMLINLRGTGPKPEEKKDDKKKT